MPIDIYADDNESQIRFLAQRVDNLNDQVDLLLKAIGNLVDKIKQIEKDQKPMTNEYGEEQF